MKERYDFGVWYTRRRIFTKYSSQTSVTILCTIPMCVIRPCFTSGVHSTWKLAIKACDNSTRASAGQGKNQSIVGQEIMPGNFLALTGKRGFIGDIQIIRCRLSLTLSIKNCLRLSWLSSKCGLSLTNLLRRSAVIAMTSSFAKRPGISPVRSTLLMYSKKTSSLISDSVNKKVVGLHRCPADLKRAFMSSIKEFLLYCFVSVI
mmetsp:Transcript_22837/g.33353  ORF Transcript_22837/g.33353 Transcript_22837/m.33353 type:complete len:204 (-) Transcript_22837:2842-3453(-)